MGREAWLKNWLLEVIAANPGLTSRKLAKLIKKERWLVQGALSQLKTKGKIIATPDPRNPTYRFRYYPKETKDAPEMPNVSPAPLAALRTEEEA